MRRRPPSPIPKSHLSPHRCFHPTLTNGNVYLVLLVALSLQIPFQTTPLVISAALAIGNNDKNGSSLRTTRFENTPSRTWVGIHGGGRGGRSALSTNTNHHIPNIRATTTSIKTTPTPMTTTVPQQTTTKSMASDTDTPVPTPRFRFQSPFLPTPPSTSNPTETNDDIVMSPSIRTDTTRRTALVILNRPMPKPPGPVFRRLWDIAQYRVCADGGANRLYHATTTTTNNNNYNNNNNENDGNDIQGNETTNPSQKQKYVPDLIRGDLDSLHPHVSSFYENEGTTVQRVSDQNSTDLDKALQAVLEWIADDTGDGNEENETNVYVYGAFGGRFDHEMSALQALFKWSRYFGNRLFLYDDTNCVFLLPSDTEVEIRLPSPLPTPSSSSSLSVSEDTIQCVVGEGPTCGLVPIGGRCDVVHTNGLQWDLDGTIPLEFGGLVSTSNRVVGEVVTIRTSHPLLFTTEVRSVSEMET